MPRPRFYGLDASKRQKILDAALGEFAARGYERASLTRILEAAGISKGALYYYFDDKADLFGTVLERLGATFAEKVGFDFDALDEESFWALGERMGEVGRELVRTEPATLRLLQAWYELPDSVRRDPRIHAFYAQAQGWLRRWMARGQALGLVRTDLPLDLLVEILHGVSEAADRFYLRRHASQGAEGASEEELARLSAAVLDIYKRIASPRPEGTCDE